MELTHYCGARHKAGDRVSSLAYELEFAFRKVISFFLGSKGTVAKKKSAPSTKKKSISTSKSIQQRILSNDGIGVVAGDIWRLLGDQSEQSLAAIKKSIDAPTDVIMAAVGWLAREDKLEFKKIGRTVKVSLR